MSKLEMMLEGERRGILTPDMQALLDEGRKRGVVPAKEQPNSAVDAFNSLGAGLIRGGIGAAGLLGNIESLGRAGINKAASALGYKEPVVSPEAAFVTSGQLEKGMQDAGMRLHEPQTTAGKYARTIGEFTPGALFGGGIVQRAVGNVVAPAVASEAAGQATEGTSLEPWARVAGGIAGGFAPGLARRVVTPFPAKKSLQDSVAALENEGVTAISAGQRVGNRPLQWFESNARDMPGTGKRATEMFDAQKEQFTQAALRKAGMQGERATQDVVNEGFARIGKDFDELVSQSSVKVTPELAAEMRNAARVYADNTPKAMRAPVVEKLANEFAERAKDFSNMRMSGVMRGSSYKGYRSAIESLARESRNAEIKQALFKIVNAFDDAVENGLGGPMREAWKKTRKEYRNALVVQKAAATATDGVISPKTLRSASRTIMGEAAVSRGKNEMTRLAQAGVNVINELPQSGTTPRAIAAQLTKNLTAPLAGAAAGGAYTGDANGGAAGFLASMLLGRALMSPAAQRYFANQVLAGGGKVNADKKSALINALTQSNIGR